MKPTKYTKQDTNTIDLGTKTIYKYPTPTKDMDIGKMVIDGRHPTAGFIVEEECSFVMYILKGNGKVFAGDDVFSVEQEDVVFVPKNNKFAVDGQMEYITFDSPAWYPEQAKEIQ